MNKPLTKEERESIALAITRTERQWGSGHKELVRAMEAMEYWIEAVKNADIQEPHDSVWCHFCFRNLECVAHDKNCPWLIAQEAPHA